MKPHVFITARLNSTRLPRKHMLKLGTLTVIDHVIKRCEHFGFEPYLCVPSDESWPDWPNLFKGDPDNVEARIMECAHTHDIGVFHHLDGDDPFFSREAVIESISDLYRGKFSKIMPSVYSQSGSGLVGVSYNLKCPADSVEAILPDPDHPPWPLRLTLDYPEDYTLLCAVNQMVGGYMAPRWAVDDLFRANPDLHRINWHRNAEWKERQLDESRHQL